MSAFVSKFSKIFLSILRYIKEIYELYVKTRQRKPKEIAIVSISYARILLEADVSRFCFLTLYM